MNQAESKTLLTMKITAITIILAIVFSLMYLSKKNNSQNITRFSEPAKPDIAKLSQAYPLGSLNLKNENFAQLIGGSPTTFISYWATWCEPCKVEIPALIKLQKQLPNNQLIFVNVDSSDNKNKAQAFWDSLNVSETTYYMPAEKVFSYSVALPYHQVFVNKNLVSHFYGELLNNELKVVEFLNDLTQVK